MLPVYCWDCLGNDHGQWGQKGRKKMSPSILSTSGVQEPPAHIPWGKAGTRLSVTLDRMEGPTCSFPSPLGEGQGLHSRTDSPIARRNVASDFTSHRWQHKVDIFCGADRVKRE